MLDRRRFLISLALVGTAGPMAVAPAAVPTIAFGDLYERQTVFSQRAKDLEGQTIEMLGFMAPPLKAESRFFVLTRMPMSVCPFCETEADWPSDIIVVYTEDPISVVPFNFPIRVTGTLELGTTKDPEMGFVSRVRLQNADFERVG
ncbi:hypothetical protein Sa4125_37550 [Aureimonas sp. SA4125]|uniref:hypothetical protein n=1 Tax=Aureimonas sp. SA4125 TaxID=2826993 RepID=UPI001CC6517C|nr:hypothetical protein [Aureimonas sp. SA4125]BDA86213.1 hypothetical protein Sa4125_37550 [Aureimonas sp. SA4125]